MDGAALQAALEQVAQQNHQLQQQVQHLMAQQAQGAASSPSPGGGDRGSPRRADKPRLPAPPAYDGRNAGGVDVWLRELRKQFAWYGSSMAADADRIRFGAAHLSGVALDWWESIEGKQPVAWAAFEEALRTRFQPANSADAARQLLDRLRQQPRQAVHEYTAEFRRLLLAIPKMEEGDRVYRFVSGLQPRLGGLVRLQAPATLADAIALAARVDGLTVSEGAGAGIGTTLVGEHPPGGLGAAAADAMVDVNALSAAEGSSGQVLALLRSLVATQAEQQAQLNALRGGTGYRPQASSSSSSDRVPNVSGTEIADRRARGACFACGKEGHRKVECPLRK